MKAAATALSIILGLGTGAQADVVLLRVEASPAVMQVDAGEILSAEIVLGEVAEPMIWVQLAPSRHEDWHAFTSDALGKRTAFYLCGELVSKPAIPDPVSGGVVGIVGPTGDELPRMVKILIGRKPCDGIS